MKTRCTACHARNKNLFSQDRVGGLHCLITARVPTAPRCMMATGRKGKGPSGSDAVPIPDKLYFRIGEVSRLSSLPSYVLRFWETEFPQLKPTKSSTGQRMYRRRDVENVLQIKRLLYQEGYTIAGARDKMKADMRSAKSQPGLPFPARERTHRLKVVRQQLQEVLTMLAPRRKK